MYVHVLHSIYARKTQYVKLVNSLLRQPDIQTPYTVIFTSRSLGIAGLQLIDW